MYLLSDSYAQITNRYFTPTFRRSISEETPLPESTSLSYAGTPLYLRYLKEIFYKVILKRLQFTIKINRRGYWQEHLTDLKAIKVFPKGNFKTYLSNL